MAFEIRACSDLPSPDLVRFLNGNNLSFNNLDWFSPNERFNEAGCFAGIEEQYIKALMAATPESPTAAWLRFFLAERNGEHARYFNSLLSQVKTVLQDVGAQSLFSLAPYEWLLNLLNEEGFQPADKVVTLQRNFAEYSKSTTDIGLIIREMTYRDLSAVEAIDIAAFDPAWQLNRASLVKTYHRSSWHSIAILDGEVVGYQMSTSLFDTAHLARLAVDPRWQGKGVGHRLVEDMLETFSAIGVSTFSVNTQASNIRSLSLYQSLGFEREDRDIQVMSLKL